MQLTYQQVKIFRKFKENEKLLNKILEFNVLKTTIVKFLMAIQKYCLENAMCLKVTGIFFAYF